MPKGYINYPPGIKLIYVRRSLAGEPLESINPTVFECPTQRTVDRWIDLYQTTSCVISNPEFFLPRGRCRTLNNEERNFVAAMIEEDPTLYLKEIQSKLAAIDIVIPLSTLQRDIRDRLELTLKVALTVDPAQCEMERAQFLFDIKDVPVECLIALDESHIDGSQLYRPRGRAPRGHRTKRLPRPTRATRHTIIAAMSLSGAVAIKVNDFSTRRETIEHYLEFELLPMTNPYPGVNSVILLDNATVHHGGDIKNLCDWYGVRLAYLPRYSPDYNPIEKAFSVMKSRFRRDHTLDREHGLNDDQIAEAIYLTAVSVMTPKMARSLFEGSIYL